MSKIKEYFLNSLTEDELMNELYNNDVIDAEYKDVYIKKLQEKILTLKMKGSIDKLKIQKLQQELDNLTND